MLNAQAAAISELLNASSKDKRYKERLAATNIFSMHIYLNVYVSAGNTFNITRFSGICETNPKDYFTEL